MRYATRSKCIECQAETTNPKFCSRSCAAKHTNRTPKRKRTKVCECGQPILSNRKQCPECYRSTLFQWQDKTIADIQNKAKYQVSALIRNTARSVYRKSAKPKCCVVCGYNKHYEVCHIKAIKDFSPDTPLSTVNHINNLTAMCPNHHWEYDNGQITI